MVLTVDVGNTNITLGGYEGEKLVFVSRISTDKDKMEDQYAIEFRDIFNLYNVKPSDFKGAIISSVVPPLLFVLKSAISKLLMCEVLTVSPGVKTGLNIKIDNPSVLGTDFVCGAVAAISRYKMPCIIFDLGTATTISALDKHASFIGASIMPGIKISLDALSSRTAQLPAISLETPHSIIGTNTVDSMKSGIVFGTASMIDGMIERYSNVLGNDLTVVATGGLAANIIKHCKSKINLDENLLLDGLNIIFSKNRQI